MSITSVADIQRVLDDYDSAYRDENCPVERRRLELRKAEEEESCKARDAADRRNKRRNQVTLIDQRVVEHFGPLKEAIGEFIASEIESLRARMVQRAQEAIAPLKREIEVLQASLADAAARANDRAQVERAANQQVVCALFGELAAKQLADRRDEIQAVLDKQAAVYERKIAELEAHINKLEARIGEKPGRLPVAKTWRPEMVTYQGEFVSHDGACWQARVDTAQAPGGADWLSVARAGRDAQSARIRGAFDSKQQYRALDVVEFDKASYIARRDDPGPIFGTAGKR
jgi:chromosome segregation ATPase